MRVLGSAVAVLALFALGFVIYDVLDFAIGGWVLLGALVGYFALRLFGWLPGGDIGGDVDL
jgi:branched-subunit amino acid ABC-type transport system permease component